MSTLDLHDGYPIQTVYPADALRGSPRDDYDFGDSFADFGGDGQVCGDSSGDNLGGAQVSYCENGYRYFSGVYLVRGIGKRSVRVIVRPFHSQRNAASTVSDELLAALAARVAAKHGWRKVVVAPDDYLGEDARVFNMDQYLVQNRLFGHQGTFLRYMGESRLGRL